MNQTPTSIEYQWCQDGKAIGEVNTHSLGVAGEALISAPEGLSGKRDLKLTLPITCVSGVWMPYGDRSTLQKVVWRGRLVGSPSFFPGIIAFVDQHLHNRLLLFTSPANREVIFTWALDQACACYRIEIEFCDNTVAQLPTVCVSTEPVFVQELAARMFAEAVPAVKQSSPREYFEPSYCTWYAFHGALEEKSVERCARLARDLGFGTWIMDDGWQYDADQRVGAVIGAWHRFNGDYQPSRRKFPDFRAHVERVRAMGLRYLLWMAPMIVGIESQAYQRFGSRLLKPWLDEGEGAVDPRDAECKEYLASAIERVVRTYPIDGFKVDYDYALFAPGQVPYGVGAAYGEFVQELVARVKRIRPSFEWNLMLNVFSANATDAFRCVDVPFDPDSNRLFMANIRPLAHRRALYSDPALWSPRDPVSAVHRHLVPSLFCVPSVGAPLLDLPRPHLDALRGWLAFYRRHQELFNSGDFRAHWAAGDFQSFSSTLEDQHVVATYSQYPVSLRGRGETLVINATDENVVRLDLEAAADTSIENAEGAKLASPKPLPRGLHEVNCPPGGVLRLQIE